MLFSKAALALSIAFFGTASQDTTYNLRHKHVEGAISKYEFVMTMEAEGFAMEIKMNQQFKVLKVEADGAYDEEETNLGGTIKFNGEEQPVDKEDPKVNHYDKDGKLKKEEKTEEEEDPISFLFDLLDGSDPVEPIKAGHKWEIESKSGKSTFIFVGAEKIEELAVLKQTFESKITKEGMSGDVSGTVWLRAADASLEKMELQTDNMVPGEGAPAGKVKVVVKRTE